MTTKKKLNVLKSILNNIDRASSNQVANETHIVAPAALENGINVTAGRSQPGFHISNLRNRTKHKLLKRIQVTS